MDGIIWFFEAEIRDGKGEVAGKRLFSVYHELRNNALSFVNPSILWDLKPTGNDSDRKTDGQTNTESSIPNTDNVLSFVIANGLESYRKELLERRKRDAEIKRKYGIRSLESMVLDSDAKISDYETRKIKGENIPEAVIQREIQKKEDLMRKKERLLREIESEIHLYPTEPKLIGAIRVIPVEADERMATDKEVEEIGMRIAMEYERGQGRVPEDVHLENLGYDIRSMDGTNYRYIEVKARAKEGAIALTPNEWLMAKRLKDEYWLYIVVNASTNPQLYTIQNPALHLKPEEEVSIVRYIVKDWKEKAEMAK